MKTAEREAALEAVIESFRKAECDTARAEARAEADALLAQARHEARTRVRRAIAAERERAAVRLRTARARRDAALRERVHDRRRELLERAWPRLRAALVRRWGSPEGRRAWSWTAAEAAMEALPEAAWSIRHAPGWPDGERDAFVRGLRERGHEGPAFAEAPELEAGLVIHAGQASLDATLDGMLADRRFIEGRILALLVEAQAT